MSEEICKTQERIEKAEATLRRLKEEDDKDEATDRSWSFMTPMGYVESIEVNEARERRMNERSTGRIVQEAVLDREKVKRDVLLSRKHDIDCKIEAFHDQGEQEEWARRAERIRRQLEREREAELERREAEAKRAEEERLRRAQERARVEEIRAKEAMQKQQQEEQERLREIRERRAQRSSTANWRSRYEEDLPFRTRADDSVRCSTAAGGGVKPDNSPCLHRGWWTEVDGVHLCHRCRTTTRRFAFACPSCSIKACSNCRDILRK